MTAKTLLRFVTGTVGATALVLPLLGPAHATGTPGTTAREQQDVYLIRVTGTPATEVAVTTTAKDMSARNGGDLRRIYWAALQGFSVTLTPQEVTKYYRDTRVSSVTADRDFRVAGHTVRTPTGAAPTTSWALDRVDQRDLPLDGSYRARNPARGVRVYLVDTGVRVGHSEFGGRARGAYDAVNRTPGGARDCNGHGTAAASIAAGRRGGVAREALVESVLAFDCRGTGRLEHLASAVDWITAHAKKPAVVNLGFSGPPTTFLDAQLYEMTQKGIAYTTAAGTAGTEGDDACSVTPARQTTGITVAATDRKDARTAASNTGPCVHLFAPGDAVPAAGAAGDIARTRLTGTSAASALAAGTAATHLAEKPGAAPGDVAEALTATATRDRVHGAGADTKNLLLYAGGDTPSATHPAARTPRGGRR
ncbi:S8 family serine peptidase [Streptomyces sp. NPDC017941]|uniref:S8 family serine peptidase n=1 Tax=Streptomyces sp. NPDC017941 TaxID=3365018 RepID=UPI0037932826